MANNYTQVTPAAGLPCTTVEALAIRAALSSDEFGQEVEHGFEFFLEGDQGYLIAEESGCWDELPLKACVLIGALVAKADLPFMEFGVAFTCSKLRCGEFGGTAFRIMRDGCIVNRTETWPGDA